MPQEQNNQKLNKYLKVSLGWHVGLFLLALVGPWIFPSKSLNYTPAVQIDMVALPDQVKQDKVAPIDTSLPVKDKEPAAEEKTEEPEEKVADKKEMTKPEPAKPEKSDMAAPKENKKAEKQAKSAIEKLKEQLKKEREEEAKKKTAMLNDRQEKMKRFEEKYRQALKGNQTNRGSSATGEMQEVVNAYAGAIADRLRNNWSLPPYLQTQGFKAVAVIYINSNGRLIRFQISKESGNSGFDEAVIRTIKQSDPLPPPPAEIASGLRNSGIEVLFPL